MSIDDVLKKYSEFKLDYSKIIGLPQERIIKNSLGNLYETEETKQIEKLEESLQLLEKGQIKEAVSLAETIQTKESFIQERVHLLLSRLYLRLLRNYQDDQEDITKERICEQIFVNSQKIVCSEDEEMRYLANMSLGEYHTIIEKWDDAEACFTNATKIRFYAADPLLCKADVLFKKDSNKYFQTILDCCDEVIRLDSSYEEARILKAKVLIQKEKYGKALLCIDETITNDSKNLQAWVCKGQILGRMNKDLPEIIKCYENVIDINPEIGEVWFLLGTYLWGDENISDAAKCFDKSFKIKTWTEPVFFDTFGSFNESLGSFDTAIYLFDKAINLSDDEEEVVRYFAHKIRATAKKENKSPEEILSRTLTEYSEQISKKS